MNCMTDIREDIYRHDAKLQRLAERINSNQEITLKNKELIFGYKDNAVARGISKARQEIILQSLLRIASASKADFDKAERKDIEKIMAELQSKGHSAWTIETSKAVIKAFFRWLYDLEANDPLPKCVRWIKRTTPPPTLTKNDLLTKEDIAKMINATDDLMQKTIISVHFESANRNGETLKMTVGSVIFKEEYALIHVGGKMEKKTEIGEKYLMQSYDLLKTYIENHPFRSDPNHPLWIVTSHIKNKKTGEDLRGKVISMPYFGRIIKNAAKRAGINKRVFGYLCRHSRGTQLYGTIGEALAKKQMLQAPDSRMARFYNHLNSDDLLRGLKEANGLKNEEKENFF